MQYVILHKNNLLQATILHERTDSKITDEKQYIFMLPLFFQVVLGDSATKAGVRLVIPSLALPLGGLVTGIVMSRWGSLIGLMRAGAIVMLIGNALTTSLRFVDQDWKYFVYIFPANLGQGMVMPAMLFTGLATFEHAGVYVCIRHCFLFLKAFG